MIFIDQVYCKDHIWLHEAIYTNLTMLHKTLFIFSCEDSGQGGCGISPSWSKSGINGPAVVLFYLFD
jgi:hypothetical protein